MAQSIGYSRFDSPKYDDRDDDYNEALDRVEMHDDSGTKVATMFLTWQRQAVVYRLGSSRFLARYPIRRGRRMQVFVGDLDTAINQLISWHIDG